MARRRWFRGKKRGSSSCPTDEGRPPRGGPARAARGPSVVRGTWRSRVFVVHEGEAAWSWRLLTGDAGPGTGQDAAVDRASPSAACTTRPSSGPSSASAPISASRSAATSSKNAGGPMLRHGLQAIAGQTLLVPASGAQRPHREFLEERYALFRRACEARSQSVTSRGGTTWHPSGSSFTWLAARLSRDTRAAVRDTPADVQVRGRSGCASRHGRCSEHEHGETGASAAA